MRRTLRGFTLVELVTVLVLVGILAVAVLPRLDSVGAFAELEYRDEIAATLRFAQKSAVAHRRLVCAATGGNQINLSMASGFPAAACNLPMPGPSGRLPAVAPPAAGLSLSVAPAGATLFFQPSGTVTSDAAGLLPADFTLTPSGQTPVVVSGATGHAY